MEVVQRKLGPISRGGEFSRPFFYFFSNFRENSLISGPFLLFISDRFHQRLHQGQGGPDEAVEEVSRTPGAAGHMMGCRTKFTSE